MSEEELNELEHAARTSVAGGLAWRLGKALASVRAERDEQESEKNAERDALRAELAAEREERDELAEDLKERRDAFVAERDALRELLREAREYTGYAAFYGDRIEADHAADLCARIDAALNEGGGNE